MAKTMRVTLWCGMGHIAGSIVLGLVGVFIGAQLAALAWVEGVRGDIAAWALVSFGLVYTVWGLRQAWQNRTHTHLHQHGSQAHAHGHDHHNEHSHLHRSKAATGKITPWLVFVIFVLGPCEPLIPLLLYPAAAISTTGVMLVAAVFGMVTVVTMLGVVLISSWGLNQFRWPALERFTHAIAGSTLLMCGCSIVFLGL